MKGYKVFNPDWSCRGFKYEVGETYKMDKEPIPCDRGFHFCKRAVDCFNYYEFDPNNKVAEVEAVGEIRSDGKKSCTNKIKILREIPWYEVLNLVNIGENCTGFGNTGNYNAGNFNVGGFNTGDSNTGCYNTGNNNTGDYNTGDYNTGGINTGLRNSGNNNTGNDNTGYGNTGNNNTGDYNAGDYNAGNCNNGDRNTGNRNTGYMNAGDWNSTNFSGGCFNTEMGKIRLFNKPSIWTLEDWRSSEAYSIMSNCPSDIIVWKSSWVYMDDEEKKKHPEAEITGGYLAKKEADVQKWWDELPESDKNIVMALPNFDANIFKECTGIEVRGNK